MLKCKETVTAALYAAQILDSEMLKFNTEQTHTHKSYILANNS